MDIFDILQLSVLGVFLIIFTGRTIQLYFRGKKVFKIGQGKSFSTNLLEISFMVGLVAWIYLVIVNALHLKSDQFNSRIQIFR